MPCVDLEQLERYVGGALDDSARDVISAHLSTCDACRTLLDEVQSNLGTLRQVRSHLDQSAAQHAVPLTPTELPGYELLRVVHEGGQGIVYEARQKSTNRSVAVKLLLHGHHATKKQRRRFEREIDLQARLEHPNIVTVFDRGETADSRVFLVTSFVHGQPLDAHTAQRSLDIRQTLDLFAKIAAAVNYAHQRGVIHRDLKPNNILVDQHGEPYLLDFGLARLIQPTAADAASLQTEAGEFLGTLAYAAPEQVSGDPHAVDVRSDVYALGIILYQALTGTHPYPPSDRLADIISHITHFDVPRPSSLRPAIDDELDAVLLKALRKEKEHRYQSVADLLRDLTNYRAGRPIEAKAGSRFYVLRKTLRRHRAPVIATGTVVLALLAATIVSLVFWRHSVADRIQAEEALSRSELEAEKATAISTFLTEMLTSVDPGRQRRDVTVREVLDSASLMIDESFGAQPEVEATIQSAIAVTYRALGLADAAEPHVRRSLEVFSRIHGHDHPQTLTAMNGLVLILIDQGRFEEAEPLALQSLDLHRAALGEDDPLTLMALNNLGVLYWRQGRRDEAESVWTDTLEQRLRVLGDEHSETLLSMSNLGWLYSNQGRLDDADRLLTRALEVRRRTQGAEHPDTLFAAANLAHLKNRAGRYAEAEAILVDTYETTRRVLGEAHQNTIFSAGCLAWAYNQQGRYEEATPILEANLDVARQAFGDTHPMTLQTMNDLAIVYDRVDRLDEAESLYRQAFESRAAMLGADHPDTLASMNNLAVIYYKRNRLDEAEELYTSVLDARTRVLGAEHPQTLSAMNNLAMTYVAQERYDEAEQLYRVAYEARVRILGQEHHRTMNSLADLTLVLRRLGRLHESAECGERLLEMRTHALGPTHPDTLQARYKLASLYIEQDRMEQAEATMLDGLEQATAALGRDDARTCAVATRVAEFYDTWGKPDSAAQYRRHAAPAESTDRHPQ